MMDSISQRLYFRLIALWAVCEAMLGGVIHGLKLPISGLVLGGSAVVIICLLSWYVPGRARILQATVLVCIFKMMLSPHSPPAAYFAVMFQGAAGALILNGRKQFALRCILFGTLALFESGIQRILVMTILYGTEFWKAVDDFIGSVVHRSSPYSLYIAGGYVLLHVLAGGVIGWFAGRIPHRIQSWQQFRMPARNLDDRSSMSPVSSRKKSRFRTSIWWVWLALLVLYMQSEFHIGTPLIPSHRSVRILVQSFVVVLTWYFLVAPLLTSILKKWLEKQRTKSQQNVAAVLELVPAMNALVNRSWQQSSAKKGLARIHDFAKSVLVEVLDEPRRLYILTGPVGTGKTTSLVKWAEGKQVNGILTPVAEGRRFFLDAMTKERFPMEANGEAEAIKVGRFAFSASAFDRAKKILAEAQNKQGWIIVDEVGPLELSGSGFHDEVKALAGKNGNGKIVFVIREPLLEKAVSYFNLENAVIVTSHELHELHELPRIKT